MNTDIYEYFITVVQEKSISRAAERLYITQQSLSAQMQRLEEHLGVTLFTRKPTFRLTVAGERFLPYCQSICNSERYMEAEMATMSGSGTAKLLLGCTRLRASVYLPEIWEHFHALHPNVIVSGYERESDTLVSMMQNGDLDMAIAVNVEEDPAYKRIPLTEETLYCVLSEKLIQKYWKGGITDFAQRFRSGLDLTQLAAFPFVLLSRRNKARRELDLFFRANKISPNIVVETNMQDIVYDLSVKGHGVGILSRTFFTRQRTFQEDAEPHYILYIKNELKPIQPYLLVSNRMDSIFLRDIVSITSSVILSSVPVARRQIELHNQKVDQMLGFE
ncbi:MAG: LysR family transcriptional regulator [Lachnospiraceae bacterium]|nr:LysR family transcriptional regulator [Lachnospiraceae bacterium]